MLVFTQTVADPRSSYVNERQMFSLQTHQPHQNVFLSEGIKVIIGNL